MRRSLFRLAQYRQDETRALRRMADFEKWTTAAEPGLGWEPGTFSRAYASNRKDNAESAFESDIIAVAIRDFMMQEYSYFWSGTATELLNKLGLSSARRYARCASGLRPRKPSVIVWSVARRCCAGRESRSSENIRACA